MKLLFSISSTLYQLHPKPHIQPFFSLISSSTTTPQSQIHSKHQSFHKISKSNPQTINNNTLNFLSHFLSLAKTLTQNPRSLKALTHLDSLLSKAQSFDSVTSVAVIEGLCNLKKLNRAKTVLLHLKDNLKVSPFFAFSLVFDCLVKDGKVDDVEIQWGEISGGSGINLSDYVIYVCKWGDLEEVKRVCERILMGSRVLERQSYVALIGAFCKYNDGLMAKCVLYEMYSRGFEVDDISYIVLFKCFCRNGDLVEADWVLRKMVMGGCHVDVCIYGSFMHGLCKAGKFKEANKLFNKLIKRDQFTNSKKGSFLKEGRRGIFQLKCEGVVPEMMAYEMYFRALCSAEKLDEAEKLLKEMMKKRSLPQICVYGSFIKALFRAGREEDAMKFFNVESKKGLVCSDELARIVAMQLCVKGRVDDALRIFIEFKKSQHFNCVILCNCLLGSLWGLGRAAEAEAFYERMKKGDLAPPNLSTFKLMVCGHCDQGNVTKALDILEKMSLQNIPIDRKIYETVIRSLDEHGWRVEAYKCINEMIEGGFVSYTGWRRVFHPLLNNLRQILH